MSLQTLFSVQLFYLSENALINKLVKVKELLNYYTRTSKWAFVDWP